MYCWSMADENYKKNLPGEIYYYELFNHSVWEMLLLDFLYP